MINIPTQNQFYNHQYLMMLNTNSGITTNKLSPPNLYQSQQQQSQSLQQQQQLTPVKRLFVESNSTSTTTSTGAMTSSKLGITQSPLNLNSFKLGTITHQSSPYINLSNNKLVIHKTTDIDDEDDDYDKPKVFQDEDIPSVSSSGTTVVAFTSTTITSGLQATSTTTTAIATITSKCDSLNISSPSASSIVSNGVNLNETSFLSSQTKSSLKSSISTNSNQTTASSSLSSTNKHVKFSSDIKAPETPIMFSRSSSLTSLNSFDAKSIHSSVASEYSRRPSGIMSPSELPDSPDESYVMSLRAASNINQMNYMQNMTRLTNESKSNEVTLIERTILGSVNKSMNTNGSNSNSEKNSFYNPIGSSCGSSNGMNDDAGDDDQHYLKDNTIAYDVEGSPWRNGALSEVSSLSALTFNDDLSEHKVTSNKDLAAILALLQTRSKENKASQQQQQLPQQQLNQFQYNQQQMNLNTLNFTPPIKLPATTKPMNLSKIEPNYYFLNNQPTVATTVCAPVTQQPPQQSFASLPLSVDIPKLYCDEYTPSNISPQSAMSELSVPSLIKQEIQQPLQKSQFNNYEALFKRINQQRQFNEKQTNNNNNNLEVVDLDVPKVYETEDNHHNIECNSKKNNFMVQNNHFLQQQNSVDTDSPKVFLTEDTPMCYSRSSSLNSVNNDSNMNITAINIKSKTRGSFNKSLNNTNKNNSTINGICGDTMLDGDDLNKSSLLLSDSCNKPTNTPAGFVNMSHASYASQNDSSDSENESDHDYDCNKENKKIAEDDELENKKDDDEDEDDDSRKENEVIKQFINQTMPVTINKDKNKFKFDSKFNHSPALIKNRIKNKENLNLSATTYHNSSYTNNNNNNSNSNIDDDEMLLQNFIKEMLPPVPTRKSTSKLPVYNKRLSTSDETKKCDVDVKIQKDESKVIHKEQQPVKSKKRLSEEHPIVHTNKIQQHTRNFSLCYNSHLNLASNNVNSQSQQSPKLNKKVTNLTLTKTNANLNATNLANKGRKLGTNIVHTASTYSLSTITTATTCSSSSACSTTSSSSNSVTANGQHHHQMHHPIVNMTRTSQLRASKVAETKVLPTRKPNATTTTNSTATTTTSATAHQVQRNQNQATKPIQQLVTQKSLEKTQPTKPLTLNIPKLPTQQPDQQLESINGGTNCLNRRKSFHGAPSISKKPLSLALRCTNENQIIQTKPKTATSTTATNLTTTGLENSKNPNNVLKKTNLNKLNK